MNDTSAHGGALEETSGRRPPERTTLTPLQDWLITLYLLLEDAQEQLDPEGWRAFVWIACDYIGIEAARLAVLEAEQTTREDLAA